MSRRTSADESWLCPMTRPTGQRLGHGDITLHLHHRGDTSILRPIWAGQPLSNKGDFWWVFLKKKQQQQQSSDPEVTLAACDFSPSVPEKRNRIWLWVTQGWFFCGRAALQDRITYFEMTHFFSAAHWLILSPQSQEGFLHSNPYFFFMKFPFRTQLLEMSDDSQGYMHQFTGILKWLETRS